MPLGHAIGLFFGWIILLNIRVPLNDQAVTAYLCTLLMYAAWNGYLLGRAR